MVEVTPRGEPCQVCQRVSLCHPIAGRGGGSYEIDDLAACGLPLSFIVEGQAGHAGHNTPGGVSFLFK